ncbi:hypothetical protein ABW16_15145 [Mycolicibacter heraklionensis]|uniref:Uncharacterized protein n=1 Tax=Mycolicibacter heraklionensis TaxID=512402 RepID=A0ABR5FDP8_9MYCO|nr:hypothetical protein [Mycolicibacter heraklionensis]KLO27899.1 hypothetical protein ABW16_15145 [Mycolicibacter heraklionensis]
MTVLTTIGGLPAHPLVAHLAAVMIFVTAVLAIVVVFWPAARRRIGGPLLFVAAGTLMAIPLTTGAGNWLQSQVMGSAVLQVHARLGGQIIVWSALLMIALICWWAGHTPLFADVVGALPLAVRRIGIAIAGTGTVLSAVASVWLVVRIGHTGAQAVWGSMGCCA